jgi:cytochrome c oxidase cbb3-type subunit 4
MDINDLRTIFTVLAFGTFVYVVWWAFSSRRKREFEEAANLILDDDTPSTGKDDAAGQ